MNRLKNCRLKRFLLMGPAPFRRSRARMLVSILMAFDAFAIRGLAYSQTSARGLGMGGAFTAQARGVQAQFWNPANLGAPDNPRFSLNFISAEAGLWNNSFTKGMYDKYNGRHWNSQDVEDILNAIPDDGLRLNAETWLNVLSFSVGSVAVSFGINGAGFFTLDRTPFTLALKGNEIGKTYTLEDIDGQALALGVFGLSYGRSIKLPHTEWFSVGTTLHSFFVGPFMNVDRAQASLSFQEYHMDLDAEFAISDNLNIAGLDLWEEDEDDSDTESKESWPLKMGWGLDLGAAARFSSKWMVGFSIFNLLGHIPWAEAGRIGRGCVQADSLTVFTDDDDKDAVLDSLWSEPAGSLSGKLPTILRLGASYQVGHYLVTADLRQDFANGAFTSTRTQLAVGTEWSRIRWLPLRMGVVIGGRKGIGTSFGLGVCPGAFRFNMGVMNCGFFTPGLNKGVVVALDLGIVFDKSHSGTARIY
ncbi:MAG TPA: DUF5723 family protein [bacterium]|nr:DUF5723 family protein [bacterium]